MKNRRATILLLSLLIPLSAHAQSPPGGGSFDGAVADVDAQLQQSLAELDRLREQIVAEKLPLSRRLNDLERELSDVRLEYQEAARLRDTRAFELSKLRSEIDSRKEEATYLSNLLSEYIRNFESRLHIAELQRYEEPLEAARLAPENDSLSAQEVFRTQADLLATSLDRLFDALGGTRFEGTAVDDSGLVKHGTFVLVGPTALFRPDDGGAAGPVEQRLNSLEPAQVVFANPEDAAAADQLVATTAGMFPLDPTLGNAHKIETTEETLWEHVQKGGPVMIPIFALAGAALLVALWKWLVLLFVRRPSQKRIRKLLKSVGEHDAAEAMRYARSIRGPTGRMLVTGVEHIEEPRELIEEIMYETVLTTRLKLQRLLPFIAICAAAAPLLGLLGTVTGIINTFKMITLFGSGDVKMLSGGISEALITTEFGLIVAIPSLLLHAFLSRKAKAVVDQMEKAAVTFVNQVAKSPFGRAHAVVMAPAAPAAAVPGAEPEVARPTPTAEQVRDILTDLLVPVVRHNLDAGDAAERQGHARGAARGEVAVEGSGRSA